MCKRFIFYIPLPDRLYGRYFNESFHLPNIASFTQRSSLKERENKLKRINAKYKIQDFQIVEMPADFVKNKTEEKKTGLRVGSMLDQKSTKKLYSKTVSKTNTRYILHTEPVFRRCGSNGCVTPQLRWYDNGWTNKFIKHIFSIIDFLIVNPYAIEIHPGNFQGGKNNTGVFLEAIERSYNEYHKKYNEDILIFIENRTGQHIQDGADINDFWRSFKDKYPDLVRHIGVMLDIQQLYTVTKDNFISEFTKIPKDCLYGVHIHTRHGVPSVSDDIPWKHVSDELKSMRSKDRLFHILP